MTAGVPAESTESATPAAADGSSPFANPQVFLPAWFALARTADLRRGRVKSAVAGPHRLALWRDAEGRAHAFAAACPHLGADLGFGKVVDGQLRCALHGWRFDGAGTCTSAHEEGRGCARRARAFPVTEKYGLIFVYPGRAPAPPFPPLPDGDEESRFRVWVLPRSRLGCHHHLATANGLDARHFDALHDIQPTAPPRHEVDAARGAVHLHLAGRYRGRIWRALTGGHLAGRFSAIGPSLAWVTLTGRVSWHALFATRPLPEGGCESRAVLFLPRGHGLRLARSVLFLLSLGRQDARMLTALRDFRPAFTAEDAPLVDYANILAHWPRQ